MDVLQFAKEMKENVEESIQRQIKNAMKIVVDNQDVLGLDDYDLISRTLAKELKVSYMNLFGHEKNIERIENMRKTEVS